MKDTKAREFSKILKFPESYFWDLSESKIQEELHLRLRELAILHLRKGKGPVAEAFRGNYSDAALPDSYEDFLQAQGVPSAWGTYIEASALAERFNVTLVLTTIKAGKAQNPFCLRRGDANAPLVQIFNRDNQHWFVNGKTQGAGNCLYNALAQALQGVIHRTDPKPGIEKQEAAEIQTLRFFQDLKPSDIVAHQKAIEIAISKAPTPSELATELAREESRLAALPEGERNKILAQIEEDRRVALRLARKEILAPSTARRQESKISASPAKNSEETALKLSFLEKTRNSNKTQSEVAETFSTPAPSA